MSHKIAKMFRSKKQRIKNIRGANQKDQIAIGEQELRKQMSFHFNRNGILDTSLHCHLFSRRSPVRVSAHIRSDHTENKSSRPRRQISRPDKCCKLSQKQKKRPHKEMEDTDGRALCFFLCVPPPCYARTLKGGNALLVFTWKKIEAFVLYSQTRLYSQTWRNTQKKEAPSLLAHRACPRDRRNYSLQNPVLRAAKMSRTMHPP